MAFLSLFLGVIFKKQFTSYVPISKNGIICIASSFTSILALGGICICSVLRLPDLFNLKLAAIGLCRRFFFSMLL
jgi:hypothetical protein